MPESLDPSFYNIGPGLATNSYESGMLKGRRDRKVQARRALNRSATMTPVQQAATQQSSKLCTVHIYIDHSNLWIEGQKTYARKNNLDVSFDPTWRVDVGRLKSILTAKSQFVQEGVNPEVKVNLYGSTPPPVDTVWQAIASQEVNVRTFARSSWSGREKQVDHEISLDSHEQAMEDSASGHRSEFMIVSGDRDMISSVSRIDRKGFTVHVWAWRSSMTGAYERSDNLKHVVVHHLDNYLEAIGFRETTFKVNRNTIDPASIVVLDSYPFADAIKTFIDHLKVPTYRYIYGQQRTDASSKDLVIIPAFAWSMSADEKADFFQAAKRVLEKDDGPEIITYSAYIQRFLKNMGSPNFVLEISNKFGEQSTMVTAGHDEEPTALAISPPSERSLAGPSTDFTEVRSQATRRRQQAERTERLSRIRCPLGRYCSKGLGCKKGHSKEEEAFFKIHGPFKLRKTRLCEKVNCWQGAEHCNFAHGEADLFCPTCERQGHRTGECLKQK